MSARDTVLFIPKDRQTTGWDQQPACTFEKRDRLYVLSWNQIQAVQPLVAHFTEYALTAVRIFEVYREFQMSRINE
jgi:hypothetical protein